MTGFESSTVINRGAQEVFALLSDLENELTWRRESHGDVTGPQRRRFHISTRREGRIRHDGMNVS